MANLLNVPDCGGVDATGNTGIPLCDAIANIPNGIIGLDSGVEFSGADLASKSAFVAKLRTLTRNPRGSRAYPIWNLINFEDQTVAATKISVGNLSTAQITGVDEVPAFSFQHRTGELFHKQLMKLQSQNLKWLIVDDKYLVVGTETSGGAMTGYTATEFKALSRKWGTPSSASNYPFSLQFADVTEYKENAAIFQADSTIKSVKGINDVDLNNAGAPPVQVTNVIKVTPISTGGKNIGIIYNTELASVSAWKSTNVQTGADGTITSVTWDATNQWFVITTDSTEYAALTAGQKLSIDLVDAAALSALSVDGFESLGPVTITHP